MPPVAMINHLAGIVESSDDAIYSKTLDGIILTWNAAAETLYGYIADEIVGKSVSLLLPEDRPQEMEEILVKVRRGERVDHFESIRARKDGTLMQMSLTISPIRDASGDVVAASSIARDITERKRAEEVRFRLAAIVESTDDAIMSLSLDGVILTWNGGAATLYGYSADEIVGESVSVLVPAGRHHEVEEMLAWVRRGSGIRFETIRLRKDGTVVPMWLTVSPVFDVSGNVVAASTIARDITECRGTEAALATARDEALVASKAKSEFLDTMSHELRTPMNGVLGLNGLLLDTALTETQRDYAQGVRASAEDLLALIADILDFADLDAGRLKVEVVDFNLIQVLEEVADLVADAARAKGVELIAGCNPEVPLALRGDVGRLRQILHNFATNAIKFTESGDVAILAGLAEEPTSEDVVVRFEVVDTGIGLDPARAQRLFEPFSQGDASSSRRYGGTGLGLAICVELAEALGGAVGVESRPGEGSTFWLRLPLAYASRVTTAPRPALASLAGRRALVVDHSKTSRLMLASQLRAWDIAADIAPDAEAALERLRTAAAQAEPFHLVLVDMDLPGMGGLDLAGVLRADPAFALLRLMLLSSRPIDDDAATRAGFVALLPKPVRLSTLHDALVRAVTPSPSHQSDSPWPSRVAAGSRGTVLIVEDHSTTQGVARAIVAKLGYGSDVAANGIEALEALDRRSYDAVLMDCHMPQMDGFEATVEIRRREGGGEHIPIIAMTAGAPEDSREKCIAAGMDDYLSKPMRADRLQVILQRWLGAAEPLGRHRAEP